MHEKPPAVASHLKPRPDIPCQQIWWNNAIFFTSVHLGAALGIYYLPPSSMPFRTLALTIINWQLAIFGITVGYHRLWSHRSFDANVVVRFVLAILGTAGFQGSIKWWCLRHRLHHRYTDDPVHDPYAATRGMLYAHMGWIFYKPNYGHMHLIDRSDLEDDIIVRLQHRYYVPLAIIVGFIFPVFLGKTWHDPWGVLIWVGLVSRLMIWHCIFLVNSLAHWHGLQPYSDEDTSKTNLIVAFLVAGEGNHNYHHAFPFDYRSDPSPFAWDPSKWLIAGLRKLGFVKRLRRAREDEIQRANAGMMRETAFETKCFAEKLEIWSADDAMSFVTSSLRPCLLLIDGYFVDATAYANDHPGGAHILHKYAIVDLSGQQFKDDEPVMKDATEAFGKFNRHTRAARWRMKELRIAKYIGHST
ncbi:hypothetical protein BDN71DRAFT_974645 [Pleurotus eryngii]|uniref:Acyl-CoA desaturase n=1 Tax=Pleurotus eryngii TaxID=5323 RepID=A0A9P5ZZQ0_PLEER|nr:hypothetical protein BDN71DRAFT_974645 [Pleurotus eryngii]